MNKYSFTASLLFLLILFVLPLAAQTSLFGHVTENGTNEPVLFATVRIFQNDVLITTTETDFDGNYSVHPINPGTYDVQFSYLGLDTSLIADVLLREGKANKLNATLGTLAGCFNNILIPYVIPLIEYDNTSQGMTITNKEINNMPVRGINTIILGFQ